MIKLWNTETYPDIVSALTTITGVGAYRNPILNQTLISLLQNEEIAAYHFTRITSGVELQSTGIIPRTFNEYFDSIKRDLLSSGIDASVIDSIMNSLKQSFYQREKTLDKTKTYFATNPFNDEGAYDYCVIYGGELALEASNANDDCKILQNIGKPVICEVKFKMKDLSHKEQQAFIQGMVAMIENAEKFSNFNTSIETQSIKQINKLMDISILYPNASVAEKSRIIKYYFR